MTMRITAEDGKTNDYTIKQKNTYNWALDYAGPTAGKCMVWSEESGIRRVDGDKKSMTVSIRTGW